ncbi:MAG: hypothetical protein JWM95_3836 [Gemmatimonadetes bacterium]|nr:hypothetical protein [Gemmatimonadota bacterium]
MRRSAEDGGRGRRALSAARAHCVVLRSAAKDLLLVFAIALTFAGTLAAQDDAPRRLDSGRFTAVYFPQDDLLAHSLLKAAVANDSFPWLPRPQQRVLIAIAPDAARFHAWAGDDAPEWGAALAFPDSRRIIMQGRSASADAGNPIEVLRHELAHLALHERLGNKPPRWFDEGYASVVAREWHRDDVLAANVALALRGTPSLDELDDGFRGGAVAEQSAYALSYRAVTELAMIDPQRGLTLFFQYWENGKSLDGAVRQAFGLTLRAFETRFQERTRQRYGGLALFADMSLAALVLMLLILPFFVARRIRDRKRLKAMLIADAVAERAERESAIAALLGESQHDPDVGRMEEER